MHEGDVQMDFWTRLDPSVVEALDGVVHLQDIGRPEGGLDVP